MELTQWVFFGPAKLIALWPHAGIAIAGALIAVQVALNLWAGDSFDKTFLRKAPVFAGLLWLIFGFYEMQIQAVMIISPANPAGSINAPLLRMDLMVLTPILYLLSAIALLTIARTLLKPTATRK